MSASTGQPGECWGSYWLNDLHIPHRWVRSDCLPVTELLVARGFNVEAVGERAQLETVTVWNKTAEEKKSMESC